MAVALALVMILATAPMAGEDIRLMGDYGHGFEEMAPAASFPQTDIEEMAPAVPGHEIDVEEMAPSATEPLVEREEMAPAESGAGHEE